MNNHTEQFIALLRETIEQNTFVKLVLSKYRGDEEDLKRVVIRRVSIKDQDCLSFVYSYDTKDVTKNAEIAAAIETISGLVGETFKGVNLFSLEKDVQLAFTKKGKSKFTRKEPTCDALPTDGHDNEKVRLIDPASPFLTALKITDHKHRVRPSMSRKWKQINKFLEVFKNAHSASALAEKKDISVVDFGAGKGYLTFAIYNYLRRIAEATPSVTGIELREELVRLCNTTAQKLKTDGLTFLQGDIGSYKPESLDVMIALHACDTATDQAIHMGIASNAEIIMCAPCCHKEARKQIKSPELLEPILQYGIHLGQEAEMVTDGLRALLLEAQGYKTQVFEFTALEHTQKNKMLLAVRHDNPVDKDQILEQVEKIKAFYSIKEHALEILLEK